MTLDRRPPAEIGRAAGPKSDAEPASGPATFGFARRQSDKRLIPP